MRFEYVLGVLITLAVLSVLGWQLYVGFGVQQGDISGQVSTKIGNMAVGGSLSVSLLSLSVIYAIFFILPRYLRR